MPFFNGLNIFGVTVVETPTSPERGEQLNTYPGLDGTERLDQGYRMQTWTVTGKLVGESAIELGVQEIFFRSLKNGNAYTYVDKWGNPYSNVLLDDFQPTSRVRSASTEVWFMDYTSTFRSLSPT